jgi:hypothetical protein
VAAIKYHVCPARVEWLRSEERRAGVMIVGRELMADYKRGENIKLKHIEIEKKKKH